MKEQRNSWKMIQITVSESRWELVHAMAFGCPAGLDAASGVLTSSKCGVTYWLITIPLLHHLTELHETTLQPRPISIAGKLIISRTHLHLCLVRFFGNSEDCSSACLPLCSPLTDPACWSISRKNFVSSGPSHVSLLTTR